MKLKVTWQIGPIGHETEAEVVGLEELTPDELAEWLVTISARGELEAQIAGMRWFIKRTNKLKG